MLAYLARNIVLMSARYSNFHVLIMKKIKNICCMNDSVIFIGFLCIFRRCHEL